MEGRGGGNEEVSAIGEEARETRARSVRRETARAPGSQGREEKGGDSSPIRKSVSVKTGPTFFQRGLVSDQKVGLRENGADFLIDGDSSPIRESVSVKTGPTFFQRG